MHVAIVGAGPAGSSAATFLARAGAKVTLLERAHFPRDKVCGDGLTPRSLWMLEELGLVARDAGPPAGGQAISRVYLASPGGVVVKAPMPAHVFGGRSAVVPRELLDQQLVQLATKAGATLREGVMVEGLALDEGGVTVSVRGGEPVRADVVLGCDGAPSVVRKALGAPDFPDEDAAFAVRVYYEGLSLSHPDAYAIFWEGELLPAYGWIFPLPNGRANVGVGLRTDRMRKAGLKLPELLDRFCAMPRASAELAGGQRVGRVRGHHLPFGTFARHLVWDRCLLLGDAAGFINPLTGEGIEFALESGKLAAETLVDAEGAGGFSRAHLAPYERRCSERFTHAFRQNGKLQRVFEHPRLIDNLMRSANRSQRVLDDLASVLLGEAPRVGPRLVAAVALGV
ncbi:MAG: NAD(P)/FAD-dependent oxidoreductase [Deltaproteobacteria bacterium]|nr:NAD(P)/FAD-dependent oxidoreductase [Deltaproteobacteria bacterium]